MFTFEWIVPADGFKWASRKLYPNPGDHKPSSTSRFLVPNASTEPLRKYDVFSNPALFRAFATTGVTEAEIAQFANRYGALGGMYSRVVLEPDPNEANTYWPGHGERLADWHAEIALMRHAAIDLWDNIRAKRASKLTEFIRWEKIKDGSRVLYVGPHADVTSRRLDQSGSATFPAMRQGDLLAPAWLALIQLINHQLKKHTLCACLLNQSRLERPAADFTVQADSLVTAMWVQFARAVADNPEFRRCDECGTDFEITTDKRADARFCSASCRVRSHRKKSKKQKENG